MHVSAAAIGSIIALLGTSLTAGVLAIGAFFHHEPTVDLPQLRRIGNTGVGLAGMAGLIALAVRASDPTSSPSGSVLSAAVLAAAAAALALLLTRTWMWVLPVPLRTLALTVLSVMAVAVAIDLGAESVPGVLLYGMSIVGAGAWVGGAATLAMLLRRREVEVRDNSPLLLRRRHALASGLLALLALVPPAVVGVAAGILRPDPRLLLEFVGVWGVAGAIIMGLPQSGNPALSRRTRPLVAGAVDLVVHHRPEAVALSSTLVLVAVLVLAA